MDDGLERACVARARAWMRGRRRRRRDDDVDDGDDFDFDDDGAARVEAWRAIVREERAKRRKVCGGDDDAREVEEEEEEDDEDVRGMSEDEVERVLLAMQEATARELEREETARAVRVREDLEREETEESERLARAVEAFERWTFPGDDGGGGGEGGRGEEARETRGVGDDEEDVLCPVCATRRVMMNRHVLFCACGGFRIARADEKVGLAYLRRRLAETFDAHGDRGCGRPSELRFDVRDAYGLDACVATCASCDFLEIVM
jgi:hypothetical protein